MGTADRGTQVSALSQQRRSPAPGPTHLPWGERPHSLHSSHPHSAILIEGQHTGHWGREASPVSPTGEEQQPWAQLPAQSQQMAHT